MFFRGLDVIKVKCEVICSLLVTEARNVISYTMWDTRFIARMIVLLTLEVCWKDFSIHLIKKKKNRAYLDGNGIPLSMSSLTTLMCLYFLINNLRLTYIKENRGMITNINSKFSNSTYKHHEECLFTYLPVPLLTEQHKSRGVCLQDYTNSS